MPALDTRRSSFTLAIVLLTGGAGVVVAAPPPAGKRPNVLFVVSDDLSSRITPTGYQGVKTPVHDRLASTATTFKRAYVQYPVCGPSRASFLSGLYPQSTGILNNVDNIDHVRPGTPSLPKVFRDGGGGRMIKPTRSARPVTDQGQLYISARWTKPLRGSSFLS